MHFQQPDPGRHAPEPAAPAADRSDAAMSRLRAPFDPLAES
ncbi:hypothetical protein [Saccharopolyspora griseoalba]|uniref:Uncharacterized protein n=1 Tax=Saccharopolyspora griseoalba TaxID=1431848 RepID=A0ABW2LKW6_9PSEU